jgi:hypothetical protein
MSEASPRHQLFQAAQARAEWSTQQLWVGYLALGGTSDAFDIEAFLHGLAPLTDTQQDVLASAVNERLDDLYLAVRVPYLATVELPPCRCQDPLAVLNDLLAAEPTEDHGDESDQ